MLGADAAGVGKGDGVSGEISGDKFIGASPRNHIFVGDKEFRKAHGLGALDPGNHQRPCAIRLGDVDCDTEVDVRRRDDRRLALRLVVEDVLARELFEGFDHGPGDDVSEGYLPAASTFEVVIDDDAVVDHELGGNRANARRCRHGETCIHVGSKRFGHAPERRGDVRFGHYRDVLRTCGTARLPVGGGFGRNWLRLGLDRGCLGYRGSEGMSGVSRLLVVLENWPPRFFDRVFVDDVLFVHFVYQPFIGSEFAGGGIL